MTEKRKSAPQRSALCALARLDPSHPGFAASREVREALESIRYYLDAWVYPHLKYASGEYSSELEYVGQLDDLRRDALPANIAARAAARKTLDAWQS